MWWKSIVMGIVQGLTEFLPISSSGHLVLLSEFLNINAPGNIMEIMLHLGTLFSVVVCFWNKIWYLALDFFSIFPFVKNKLKKNNTDLKGFENLSLYLIIASIPAVITGLFLDNFFSVVFDKIIYTGFALLLTGCILWFADKYATGTKKLSRMSALDALIIGLWQSLAVIPGISRAGMTISAGFKRGFTKESAVEWSFLMSLPIIAGATLIKIPQIFASQTIALSNIVIGTIAAFLSGILAIKLLLKIIKQHGWRMFSIYCWIVGLVIIIFSYA